MQHHWLFLEHKNLAVSLSTAQALVFVQNKWKHIFKWNKFPLTAFFSLLSMWYILISDHPPTDQEVKAVT